MNRRYALIAVGAFCGAIILVASWRYEGAASAAVVGAFALVGTVLCSALGVCPI